MRKEGWERQNCRHNPRPPGGKIARELTTGEQSTKVKDTLYKKGEKIRVHWTGEKYPKTYASDERNSK